ncbi:CybS-domain-containing protein [Glomus cerebriforme]|uniref:Succinate dehydrogenase [ubiquinone] cytochrome b small subunit n=1 Tax=Glomus cerebriforme TaxID=658196 RepID=A0A397SPT8_9GLOM|nr:CybS-domain-containing protein [Glomus cerebriforme]
MSFRLYNAVPRLINPIRRTPTIRILSFHTSRACAFKATKTINDGATFIKGSVNEAVKLPPRDKVAGSYHWDFERLLSVALVPLTVASVVNGAHPITDLCLGVILPIHCHIGFDAIITDYLPFRRNPIVNKVATWGLRGATLIVLYGCYEFNTNDVGLTEVVKRVWNA